MNFPCRGPAPEPEHGQESALIEQIKTVLATGLNCPHMSKFSPAARLNEDLYLDSVMIMQLLLTLELEHGYEVPDEALNKDAFNTVQGLAEFLLSQQMQSQQEAAL